MLNHPHPPKGSIMTTEPKSRVWRGVRYITFWRSLSHHLYQNVHLFPAVLSRFVESNTDTPSKKSKKKHQRNKSLNAESFSDKNFKFGFGEPTTATASASEAEAPSTATPTPTSAAEPSAPSTAQKKKKNKKNKTPKKTPVQQQQQKDVVAPKGEDATPAASSGENITQQTEETSVAKTPVTKSAKKRSKTPKSKKKQIWAEVTSKSDEVTSKSDEAPVRVLLFVLFCFVAFLLCFSVLKIYNNIIIMQCFLCCIQTVGSELPSQR